VKELKLFGSARSAGTKVQTKWGEVICLDDLSYPFACNHIAIAEMRKYLPNT
jgi:hypothetical protein